METPQEIFEGKKRQLEEARSVFEQLQRGGSESDQADFQMIKRKFDSALADYRQALQDYLPLSPEDNIPAPPLMRAAYSDRMAWLMANMANMAYIRFDYSNQINRQQEIERLKFCLASGEYGHKTGENPSSTGLVFELLDLFDTSEGLSQGRKQTDTQAFLVRTAMQVNNFAVLAFRGTQPDRWIDILTDIQATLHRTRAGEVHTGFRDAYREVQVEIQASLEKVRDLPLYITGHSLGAGLATVATQDLGAKFGDQIAACYTFGSPRVGDGKYEYRMKAPVYRVVNTTDVVTLVPWLFWAYTHVGDARYLSRDTKGKLLYNGIPSLVRLVEALLEMLSEALHWRNPLSVWVDAHMLGHYVDKLKRIAIDRKTL